MRVFQTIIALTLLLSTPAYAADPVYAKNNLANDGYDVVAYFSLNAGDNALEGVSDFSTTHDGYTYQFSSQENLDAFKTDPFRFLPAYGGYCAYAVSAAEKKVKVDPNAWAIDDGTLYLNYSTSVQKKWQKDQASHIDSADKIWPAIKESPFKKGWF